MFRREATFIIWPALFQAYAFMILTDEYGSIPYTEGGAGYSDQVFFPKYDAQQDIYPKIIQELTEASAALNRSGNHRNLRCFIYWKYRQMEKIWLFIIVESRHEVK